MSLSPAMNMWLTDAADGGCGGGLDFAPMHAICSVGQSDLNIPSLSPRGTRSKSVSNFFRHEYQNGCGRRTLVLIMLLRACEHNLLVCIMSLRLLQINIIYYVLFFDHLMFNCKQVEEIMMMAHIG